MDIASSWGGGADISMAAVTYPKSQAYKDGGVLVWYEDAGVKLMLVGPATMRTSVASSKGVAWCKPNRDRIPGMSFIQFPARDPQTAKYNTAAIIAKCGSSTAAGYCYNNKMDIDGVEARFALPNIQQLTLICQLRNEIDALDPTAAQYPSAALNNWGFVSGPADAPVVRSSGIPVEDPLVWSSSMAEAARSWAVCPTQRFIYSAHVIPQGVVPILELDPVTLRPLSS